MKNSFLLLATILLITGCSAEKAGEDSTATSTATSTKTKEVKISKTEITPVTIEENKVSINTEKSTMTWNGKKFTGSEHNGTIDLEKGEIHLDASGNTTGGNFTINMTTIKDKDGSENLEKHLKNEDFFDTTKFPKATLSITHIFPDGKLLDKAEYTITADLTIKGISRDIVFPATVSLEDNNLEINADLEIDRTRWGVKYGSGKFFKGLGDKVINDEMNFKIKLVATLPEIITESKTTTATSTEETESEE